MGFISVLVRHFAPEGEIIESNPRRKPLKIHRGDPLTKRQRRRRETELPHIPTRIKNELEWAGIDYKHVAQMVFNGHKRFVSGGTFRGQPVRYEVRVHYAADTHSVVNVTITFLGG